MVNSHTHFEIQRGKTFKINALVSTCQVVRKDGTQQSFQLRGGGIQYFSSRLTCQQGALKCHVWFYGH